MKEKFEAKRVAFSELKQEAVIGIETRPVYFLEWSMKFCEYACHDELAGEIIAAIDDGVEMDALIKHLEMRMLNMSRFPSRSTSPMKNLMHELQLAACAEAIADLRKLL